MAPRRVRYARVVGAASRKSYDVFTPAVHIFATGLCPIYRMPVAGYAVRVARVRCGSPQT